MFSILISVSSLITLENEQLILDHINTSYLRFFLLPQLNQDMNDDSNFQILTKINLTTGLSSFLLDEGDTNSIQADVSFVPYIVLN